MKLLHTGDLHLDSPFSSMSVAEAQKKREGQRKLLKRIFDCAREESCDLILIAGDLFDSRYVTKETEELLLRLLEETPCQVLLATGNHDPYVEGSLYQKIEKINNVHVFGEPRLSWVDFPQWRARVYGYGFGGAFVQESPLNGAEPQQGEEELRILCAHGDLGAPLSRYAPISVNDIVKFDIHYAALGHVHCPGNTVEVGNTLIQYCGFPQGRSFDEPDEGGVWIVSLTKGARPICERRILSEEQYWTLELDVSALQDEEAIASRIQGEVQKAMAKKGMHLRIHLTGTTVTKIQTEELLRDAPSVQIKDLTVPAADTETLKKDVSLRGALYRVLYPSLISDRPEQRARAMRALRIGLAAIDDRNIPTEEDLL